MKKIIILFILIICIIINGYFALIEPTLIRIISVSILIVLVYIISKCKIEDNVNIYKMLIIFVCSCVYLTIYILSYNYIKSNDVLEVILLLPGVLGILASSIIAIKIMNDIIKK